MNKRAAVSSEQINHDAAIDRATKAVNEPDPAPMGVSHPDMPIVEDENKVRVKMHQARARRAPVRVADDA